MVTTTAMPDNYMYGDLFTKRVAEGSPQVYAKLPPALDMQVGGDHYKQYKIQPVEYAMANKLNYCQANAIKYVTRYRDKGGVEDLRKAIHNIEILIELESK